jgi:hypothetical protein
MPEDPADEPSPETEPFDADDWDDTPLPAATWLGAMGQMIAAGLVVLAVVALSIAAAVAFRRLLP